jgi:NhaP-type Na+/H+ and K+/H+ antiporters
MPAQVTPGVNVLMITAVIITLGVAAQVLADRFRVPSVLFLILTGVAVGPEGLGLVTRDVFGSALSTIVGLSVAIIVFEGAFHLDHEEIHEARSAALHLVTVGAAISFVGTALAAHYLLGTSWGISGLIGALLIATGPTVVTPILDVVPVRDHVAAALETEGIVNDVTAAILAVVVFKLLASTEVAPSTYLIEFVERLSIGVFVGLAVAIVLWFLLTQVELPAGWTPQHARLMTLAARSWPSASPIRSLRNRAWRRSRSRDCSSATSISPSRGRSPSSKATLRCSCFLSCSSRWPP